MNSEQDILADYQDSQVETEDIFRLWQPKP